MAAGAQHGRAGERLVAAPGDRPSARAAPRAAGPASAPGQPSEARPAHAGATFPQQAHRIRTAHRARMPVQHSAVFLGSDCPVRGHLSQGPWHLRGKRSTVVAGSGVEVSMQVTAWSNGSTGYGLDFRANDRDRFFDRNWRDVVLDRFGLTLA